ncbi:hypothetical protein GCM10009795_004780 [Nocardioides hankookensis]
MIGNASTTAPRYSPRINVPAARLAITSCGPESPSRTPRLDSRENFTGDKAGSPDPVNPDPPLPVAELRDVSRVDVPTVVHLRAVGRV